MAPGRLSLSSSTATCTARILAALGAILLVSSCNPFAESDYANCVIANDTVNFTGKRLKHDGSAVASRIPATECAAQDSIVDGGDGERLGRVRWVVCLQGPDCDEAGMH